jgi:hypothetical protein
MVAENVDVVVKDTTLSADPIQGALLRVYNQAGTVFFTQAITDADGAAALLLEPGTYQIRFYKQHVGFKNPLYITVLAAPVAPDSNIFDTTADILTPPTPTDVRLCTAYGFFRKPDGSPAPNVDVHFIAKFKPILLEGDAVLTPQLTARTDARGYLQINLIRFGKYDVTVQGIDDEQRCITIPNTPNVNLPDLLLPVVDRVTFDPPGPYALAVGEDLQVTPTIIASDGNEVGDGDVQWSSSDTNVLAVLPAGGVLTLRGIGAGTANIQAVRADQSIVRIPDTPIEGVPLAAVVT